MLYIFLLLFQHLYKNLFLSMYYSWDVKQCWIQKKMNVSKTRLLVKAYLSKKEKVPSWPQISIKLSAIKTIIIAMEIGVIYFSYIQIFKYISVVHIFKIWLFQWAFFRRKWITFYCPPSQSNRTFRQFMIWFILNKGE